MIAFIDEHFLDLGKFFIGYFHAEVAARDHNAVCDVQDFIDIVHSAAALDFGNKVNIRVAVRFKEFADVDDVLCLGGERTGNKVDALLNAEQDILFVLLAQILQAERFVGEEHTLFVGQFAADLDFRAHALFVDIGNAEHEQSVVEQNGVARFQVIDDALIGNGDFRLVSFDFFGGKGKIVALF